MKIYVMRHGQTDWNVQKKIQGQSDIKLNEEGRKQALAAKEKVKQFHFDLIISSPLSRAKQTAELVKEENTPIIYSQSLVERGFGELEGEVLDLGILEEREKYYTTKKQVESIEHLCQRITDFLEEIQEKQAGKKILLVTHGGVTKAIQYYFTGILKSANFQNGEIREYDYETRKKG